MIQDRNLKVGTRLVAKGRFCIVEPGTGKAGISFRLDDGQHFTSLSAAGSVVLGGKSVNGWALWSVESGSVTHQVSVPIHVVPMDPQGHRHLDVTPFHSESDPEPDEGYESVDHVRTSFFMGRCPFRGHPFDPELDERCPPSLPAIAIPVEVTLYRGMGEAKMLPHVAPRMHEDSYCWICTHDQIREKEAGLSPSVYKSRPKKSR